MFDLYSGRNWIDTYGTIEEAHSAADDLDLAECNIRPSWVREQAAGSFWVITREQDKSGERLPELYRDRVYGEDYRTLDEVRTAMKSYPAGVYVVCCPAVGEEPRYTLVAKVDWIGRVLVKEWPHSTARRCDGHTEC